MEMYFKVGVVGPLGCALAAHAGPGWCSCILVAQCDNLIIVA